MDTMDLVRRVDELIETGNRLLTAGSGEDSEKTMDWDSTKRFHKAMESFVEEIHGSNHHRAGEFATGCDKNSRIGIEKGVTVLQAVRKEILYAAEFGH
jgi:hypothetical protein